MTIAESTTVKRISHAYAIQRRAAEGNRSAARKFRRSLRYTNAAMSRARAVRIA
jgi:hypothetical protein